MTWPFENDTSAITKKLAKKSLQSEKRRNLMVVIAVALAALEGRVPEKANEVVVSEYFLSTYGNNAKIGWQYRNFDWYSAGRMRRFSFVSQGI
ncbi:Uncharacterised protein [Dorea longicatena]|nr:Uncharacterised protein [Dorea longicatena]